MKITGTFIDEISHDIPSANWGESEWIYDFDVMKKIGIDTVILIRAGYKDRMTFNSETLQKHANMRPAYSDLVQFFLDQAARCGMKLYFGIYDSGVYWHNHKYENEIDINRNFTEEVFKKYGQHRAFAGWYLSHEMSMFDEQIIKIYTKLTSHLKSFKELPILMSPYVNGRKQFDDPISPEEHEKQWDMIFSMLSGKVDIVAFQDGQVDFSELPAIMKINKKLADKHNLISWSNIETFERGMALNFLPIAWPNLRFKIETAEKVGVEKLITFEFSHFLSPNSMYASAQHLFNRYSEWLEQENKKQLES